ncbi:phosphinothricin acetyltransferase [Bacillus mesophilus]|uniref:N-acetyltransferase n=1 Tax=Bacillus mesophilus TaxID=1808955 RepID=A0A6M0Q4J5_9BACI|nr:arsinothricin resistance N-acetyltransferase ArsN1 family A [Bacillus mesophilus]MBM7661328.1 phosphinothricin acetyltransferase [Bacillus mesophilus]NEY71153.1 N-acetyltransferase [Bacillus mesophilus]
MDILIRTVNQGDLPSILRIYNQGIEDRIATLETDLKDLPFMEGWFEKHQERYQVIVAESQNQIVGWASLNPYNLREAYKGVADLSLYIEREFRGKGIGGKLLKEIEGIARENRFHKIILFTFPFNQLGQGLYQNKGYRDVGVFKHQGILDNKFVDVMAMEKLLINEEDTNEN